MEYEALNLVHFRQMLREMYLFCSQCHLRSQMSDDIITLSCHIFFLNFSWW
jgi:hypothetical protein